MHHNSLKVFAFASVIALSPVYADPAANNIRFGLGLATESTYFKGNTDANYGALTTDATPNRSYSSRKTRVSPSIEFGGFIDNFYIGAIGSFHPGNTRGNSSVFLGTKKYITPSFKAGPDYKLALKTGYRLPSSTLLYIRNGLSFNRIQYDTKLVENGAITQSHSVKKNQLHADSGVGIEMPITEALTLTLEYTHTFSRTINNNGYFSTKFDRIIAVVPKAGIVDDALKYSKDTVSLRLSYYF